MLVSKSLGCNFTVTLRWLFTLVVKIRAFGLRFMKSQVIYLPVSTQHAAEMCRVPQFVLNTFLYFVILVWHSQ